MNLGKAIPTEHLRYASTENLRRLAIHLGMPCSKSTRKRSIVAWLRREIGDKQKFDKVTRDTEASAPSVQPARVCNRGSTRSAPP